MWHGDWGVSANQTRTVRRNSCCGLRHRERERARPAVTLFDHPIDVFHQTNGFGIATIIFW